MSRRRRTIQKRQHSQGSRGELTAAPVWMALCLTAALAAGAIVSTLEGPWMWGSLLSLPVLLAVAIGVLERIPQQWVRRSLQLAIVGSLALHLVFLIIAAWTQLFPSVAPTQQVVNAPRPPERVLLTQRSQPTPIWEELRVKDPTEVPAETTRENQSTSVESPTTAATMPETTAAPSSLVRAESSTPSLVKLSETLSQKRRSTSEVAPESGGTRAESSRELAAMQRARPSAAAASSELTGERNSEATSAATAARASESPAEPTSTPTREQAAQRATSAAAAPLAPLATTAPGTAARLRSATPDLAQTTSVAADSATAPAAHGTTRVTAEPAATLQSQRLATAAPSSTPRATLRPETVLSPATSAAREQPLKPVAPSLSALEPRPEPRRSRVESTQLSSPTLRETTVATSTLGERSGPTTQRAPTSTQLANSRGALAADARNIGTAPLPTTNVAPQPSVSARRASAQHNADLTEALVAQQAPATRRARAMAELAMSVQQVTTEAPSAVVGARRPAAESQESSAAQQSSSLPQDRVSVAADQGAAELDTGANKAVADAVVERAEWAGGGAAELGALDLQAPATAQRGSRTEPASWPAATVAELAAPAGGQTEANTAGAARTATPAEGALTPERAARQDPTSGATTGARDSGQLAAADVEAIPAPGLTRASEADLANTLPDWNQTESNPLGRARKGPSRAPQADPTWTAANSVGATAGAPRSSESQAPAGNLTDSQDTEVMNQPAVASRTAAGRARTASADARPADTLASPESLARASRDSLRGELAAAVDVPASSRRGSRTATDGSAADLAVPNLEPIAGVADRPRTGSGTSAQSPRGEREFARAAASQRRLSDEPDGPSGLGETPALDAGITARPASRDAQELQLAPQTRFQRAAASAAPATRVDATTTAPGFVQRQPNAAGGPSTEAAIELGLQFLSNHQNAGGQWSLGDFDRDRPERGQQLHSDTAATGLAILAFQGAGYTHREFKYAPALQRALDWLIQHQSPDGCLYVEQDPLSNNSCRMYSHAIATLALTEAYGMTQDPQLREPCRLALAYLEQTQDPVNGGWRYFADLERRRTDTSVTGWALMAFQSARLAGLPTSKTTLQPIEQWLELARDPLNPGRYRYDPFAPTSNPHQREPTPSMTAVGLLMRLYLGWSRDDERLVSGAESLLANLPNMDDSRQRDTYYWYYATQVLRHVGGERWTRWNSKLHPLLTQSQIKTGPLAGSWDPYGPVPDRWGPAAGRLYVTTLNLLSLEVDYRLLPLYHEHSTAARRQ